MAMHFEAARGVVIAEVVNRSNKCIWCISIWSWVACEYSFAAVSLRSKHASNVQQPPQQTSKRTQTNKKRKSKRRPHHHVQKAVRKKVHLVQSSEVIFVSGICDNYQFKDNM
jgi:hypothetical protein